MQNDKPPRKIHPIVIYVALSLLTINALFLAALYFKGDQTSAPTPPSSTPTTIVSPTVQIKNTPGEAKPAPVRLAWFTSLPKKTEDILQVTEWFDLYILIQGDEDNRDLIKSLGVEGPILQYLEFESIQDPGSCTDEPRINQVADLPGDFCRINEQHPDWFMTDTKGERIALQDNDNKWYVMDPGNAGWRSFYLERIREFQADPNWDGVFLDNLPVTLAFREADGNLPAAYPDDASYQAAVQGFLKFLAEEYFQPNHKLLFSNLVSRKDDADWVDYIKYLDGAMHEGWAIDWPDGYRPAETWEKHMQLVEQTQQMGKTIVLVSQGKKEDTALQKFAFASYLLVNQGSAAFRYANSDHYREIWLYDDYAMNLGESLGPRYKIGGTWRRDFTHGTVMVNPETHEVEIIIN